MIEWFKDNATWLLGGGGLVGVVALILTTVNTFKKKVKESPSQSIKSGDNSTNMQSGRDIKIETGKSNE